MLQDFLSAYSAKQVWGKCVGDCVGRERSRQHALMQHAKALDRSVEAGAIDCSVAASFAPQLNDALSRLPPCASPLPRRCAQPLRHMHC